MPDANTFADKPPPWAREFFTDEQRAELPYIHLWRYALEFSELTVAERGVGHVLANHAPGPKWFGLGVETIAKGAGLGRSTAIRALAELERCAFVARSQTKGGRARVSRYLLIVPATLNKPSRSETVRPWEPSRSGTVRRSKPSQRRRETVPQTTRNRPAPGREEALQEALQDGAAAAAAPPDGSAAPRHANGRPHHGDVEGWATRIAALYNDASWPVPQADSFTTWEAELFSTHLPDLNDRDVARFWTTFHGALTDKGEATYDNHLEKRRGAA